MIVIFSESCAAVKSDCDWLLIINAFTSERNQLCKKKPIFDLGAIIRSANTLKGQETESYKSMPSYFLEGDVLFNNLPYLFSNSKIESYWELIQEI